MSKCGGIHCPGCGGGGGGWWLAGLAAVVIIGAIIARPVMHAASTVGHVIGEVLHIVIVVLEMLAVGAVAGVTIGAALIITSRVRRQQAERRETRQLTERARVDAILRREQLAPRVWHADVLHPQQQQITTPKEKS